MKANGVISYFRAMRNIRLILLILGVLVATSFVLILVLKPNIKQRAKQVVVAGWGSDVPTKEAELELWIQESLARNINQFTNETSRNWKEKRDIFDQALIAKAAATGFDAATLLKALESIRASTFYPYIPIAAYTSNSKGEPVWIVSLHCTWVEDGSCLTHVATRIFTMKDTKQVGDYTCR
jgi:hypothetical protein